MRPLARTHQRPRFTFARSIPARQSARTTVGARPDAFAACRSVSHSPVSMATQSTPGRHQTVTTRRPHELPSTNALIVEAPPFTIATSRAGGGVSSTGERQWRERERRPRR